MIVIKQWHKVLDNLKSAIKRNNYVLANELITELSLAELKPAAYEYFRALEKHYLNKLNGQKDINKRFDFDLGEQLDYFYGNHRSGWAYAIRGLENDSIPGGIYLDTFIERTFSWSPEGIKPIKKPWIGIIHVPPNVPKWFQYEQSNDFIFQLQEWKDSLPYCRGLFTLSEYHKKVLEKKFDFPIVNIFHPTEIPDVQWAWEKFQNNPDKKIVQVGWWLRKLHAIYQLPDSFYKKIFLKPTSQEYLERLLCEEKERLLEKGELDDNMLASAEIISYLPDNEYDRLLSENIAFIQLYDSSANNAVIECMARATPLLVNPIEAVVEYLGKDYPFYFQTLDEAIEKATDTKLVKETHEYLKSHPNLEKLSRNYFKQSITNSSILKPKEKITIITVVLNQKDELRSTMDSVLDQSYSNIEYIIIDGGSTDGTLDLIQEYDDRIDYWISEPDKGIYDAMNKGVRIATGGWINFLNAGDRFYSPETVEKVTEHIDETCDLIFGHTFFEDEGKMTLRKAQHTDALWKELNFNHNSLFARKVLLEEHPFSLDYKIVADSEFVIWCYKKNKKFVPIDQIINIYKTGGFSDANSILRTVERWKLVSEYELEEKNKINDFYFQRLLWENPCKTYLKEQYNISLD